MSLLRDARLKWVKECTFYYFVVFIGVVAVKCHPVLNKSAVIFFSKASGSVSLF